MFTTLSAEFSSLDVDDLNVLADHNFDSYFATMCAHYFANPDFHNNLKSMCRWANGDAAKEVVKLRELLRSLAGT